jgi:SH3-like domain-containing protein
MNLPSFISSALLLSVISFAAHAQQDKPRVLTVKADYVELHRSTDTAQQFYVVEKGEKIQLLARRMGFLQVQTHSGVKGWLAEQDISALTTLEGQEVSLNNSSALDFFKIKGDYRQ